MIKIENACRQDARELADLINLAGEGIPEYLWSGMVKGQESPMEVGMQRAEREEGGFSYRNARVIRDALSVVGMIISYRLDDPYILDDLKEYPKVVQPLVQLESRVPGSWYINAIATAETHRGRGIAKVLLDEAEWKARKQNVDEMSLIVSSENTAAKKLYIGLGYEAISFLPVVNYPGALHGGNWELMVKPLSKV